MLSISTWVPTLELNSFAGRPSVIKTTSNSFSIDHSLLNIVRWTLMCDGLAAVLCQFLTRHARVNLLELSVNQGSNSFVWWNVLQLVHGGMDEHLLDAKRCPSHDDLSN